MNQNAAVASLFPQGRVNPCDVATQLVATLPRAQLAKSYVPFRQRRHRFHQCQNRRTLRSRNGGKIDGGSGLHGLELP